TLPVLDILRQKYPEAEITVMVGPRPCEIFKDNPYVHNLIIYDKYAQLREKVRLFFRLRKENFDAVIDLRNTLYGALLPARCRTSPFLHMPSRLRHMREQNLYRLQKALMNPESFGKAEAKSLFIGREDKDYMDSLLQKNKIGKADKIIILSAAAGGKTRRWDREKFVQLCGSLTRNYTVILVGREEDKELTQYIYDGCTSFAGERISDARGKIFDFAGLTNLAQLAFLLKQSSLVVVCDTGVLQLASYLDVPVVGLFGPSDEQRYGPWSGKFKIVSAGIDCRPCRSPECKFDTVECMHKIDVNKVLDSIDALLKSC
ncbi:MAG: glycosyltransferase family 9 protein, partial [Candidatus Omnitrophota bacterium]